MTAKLSTEDVRKRVLAYNLELIGKYTRNRNKTEFRCYCGNIFSATPAGIFSGNTRSCGCLRFLSQEDVASRATLKNFELVGNYVNSSTDVEFKCHCGGDLQAHHLDGYHWCVDRRYEINNGVTLCKECHYLFHNKYGNKNNTIEQFNEFFTVKALVV